MIALCGELTQSKFLFTKSSQPADAFSLLSHWMHHFLTLLWCIASFHFVLQKRKKITKVYNNIQVSK